MTRRPGTESSRGSIGCFPSNLRAPFLCPASSATSSSSSCSCSSPTSSSATSTTYVLGRASLVAPKRPSYSFVRPNFYERLPARESRNCLFSGTPGTSWSRPRHREIESSGFPPLSSPPLVVYRALAPSLFLILSAPPKRPPSHRPLGRLLAPRFTFVTAEHGKRRYCERERELCISFDIVVGVCGDAPATLAADSRAATLIQSRLRKKFVPRKLSTLADLRDATACRYGGIFLASRAKCSRYYIRSRLEFPPSEKLKKLS